MLKKFLIAAVFSVASAGAAFASSCPVMVGEIDAALAAGPDLTAEELAEVQALRDEGQAQHESGDHAGSVETLQQAKDMLGL